MSNLPRREFLRRTASVLGAATTLSLLPASIRRALAIPAATQTGTIQDIKHVVILMQENRSFDHYFGTLRGVRGFGDPFPIPLQSGKPVWFESDGTTEIPPYHLNPAISSALLVPDMPHAFSDAQAAWNQGMFGQWPHYKTQYSMGYYRRADIPFQFALAEAFTICDDYHCSITTGTDPNRIVFFSGSNFDPTLRAQGINGTYQNAEVNNQRCAVSGTMPTPGYTYAGTALTWPTLPDLLQAAGVSWRIYQDPNNNWGGLMHGGLAFQSFRQATAESGGAIYENGMTLRTIQDLQQDASSGNLPQVSWILPSRLESEHPAGSSPDAGAYFISQVLDAITANPSVWSQTAFFVTFDENDGLFDHIPPPAVPSFNAEGILAGGSTLPLAGEYFDGSTGGYLNNTNVTGSLRPWGMGARVPMYVISPWSRGGWVNSQVFDHTSLGMFLEKRFGVQVDSISPWHRAVSGDLTSAFNFKTPNDSMLPVLPNMSNYATVNAAEATLPLPMAPVQPQALFQERGFRSSRALPYVLNTTAYIIQADISLTFANSGSQGAVFHVYDQLHLDRIPRRYTVEAGKSLTDGWSSSADAGAYNLWVYAPNGFVRSFEGNASSWAGSSFKPETLLAYNTTLRQLLLQVRNRGTQANTITVTPNNEFLHVGVQTVTVPAGSTIEVNLSLKTSANWYDFTAAATNFERRFAGRMETGQDGFSDPAMAINL
jgi:phospholipase C